MSQAEILSTQHFSPSVSLIKGRPATTFLAIAEHFGKRHDHVCRDIRRLCEETPEEFRAPNFGETFRTIAGPNNSERQEAYFTVYFDGFILLVMGYTGKKALTMKLAYISAFNAMRDELSTQTTNVAYELPPHMRAELKSLVDAKLSSYPPSVQGKARAEIWTRFNRHFHIAEYAQLQEAKMSEARDYLIEMEVKALRALPQAGPTTDEYAPIPLPSRESLPADMDAGRKDALTKIQHLIVGIQAAADVVYLYCNPGPCTMKLPAHERTTWDARRECFFAAQTCLEAARKSLEAGYRLDYAG